MTSEKLAEFRDKGMLLDPKFDRLAVIGDKMKEKEGENARITNIQVKSDTQKEDNNKYFIVRVSLSTNYYVGKVEVEIDGKTFQAFQKSNVFELSVFYANVYIDFSSIVRFEDNFTLIAKLSDSTNKTTDTKSIIVKVDNSGNASVTDDKVEDENTNLVGCGIEYRDKIKCYKYGSKFGPIYIGSLKMSDYSKWDDLVTSGKITNDEKDIIIAMSENEGNLDAINGYDNQIVSIGAMQKTVNPQGYGELPIQIWEFGLEFPEKYKSLLLNCGWRVEEETEDENKKEITPIYKIYYNDISDNALYKKIRNGFNKENQGKLTQSIPIEPLIKLTKDDDFQGKQIEDFIERLHKSIQKKPSGYSNRISEFLMSNLGKATVLDHDINRPAHVSKYFGEALNQFYKLNKDVPKKISEWGENHNEYENKILEIYGPLRGKKLGKVKTPMTDASNRYSRLKTRLL
jgi:hypothetical protein